MLRAAGARSSQVAAYFTIERIATRQAVGGLPVERLSVFEDGTAVPPMEARAVLLDPSTVAAHYTVVLVDAGGAAARAGLLPSITAGVRSFVERIGERQRVAVYAFDGEAVPRTISERARPDEVLPRIDALAGMTPRDSSTNLRGAVVWGLQRLDRELAAVTHPLKFGTLVVFTATPDIADRVTAVSMNDALTTTPHEVYAAGVGPDVTPGLLQSMGRTQSFHDPDLTHARRVFELVSDRIAARSARHYLLSYCSPLRADRHRVRIEAREEGGAFGSAEFDLDATGFRAACDPRQAPAWGQPADPPVAAPTASSSEGAGSSGTEGAAPPPPVTTER
jgi:hypothetical protein